MPFSVGVGWWSCGWMDEQMDHSLVAGSGNTRSLVG